MRLGKRKKRQKSGPDSYRSLARLPRGAGHATNCQNDRNLVKSDAAMAKYRTGYRKMWATCPRVCKAGKLKKPGSYNINNWHGGVMPGWPNEHKLTNKRVSKIMRACIQSRKLTYSNLEDVRRCLSYLWETTGQKTKLMGNWPAVGSLWDSTVRLELSGSGAEERFSLGAPSAAA